MDETTENGDNYSGECALKQLSNLQSMIDITTTELVAIRGLGLNQCNLKQIRILEGKLIKHFSQQLDMKSQADTSMLLAELQLYPSLPKWLTVVGVSSLLANALNTQGCSVEELLGLSSKQLQSIVSEMGGNSEDDRKLSSSLTQLKKYHDRKRMKLQDVDITNVYWDSWSKSTDEDVFNLERDRNDINENHKPFDENGLYDQSNGPSRNGSVSSDSLPNDTSFSARFQAVTDVSNASDEIFPSHRNRHLPSTSSSCLTPPSPSHSRSSLDSDSGTSGNRNTLSSSPPPHLSKSYVIPPSTGQSAVGVYTPPATPKTPLKSPHNITHSAPRPIFTSTSSMSRGRVSSIGAGSSVGRSRKINPNALLPSFNNLKPSKSSEWHVGNRIQSISGINENLTASNQSLSSIVQTKHSKPTRKQKKPRPGNLVLTESDVPNFILIARIASRRGSITVSPESALNSTSPLSPRTPMTPATPQNPEMSGWEKDMGAHPYVSSQGPKTPKSVLKAAKALFVKIGRKTRPKRNKSSDQIMDENPYVTAQTENDSNTPRRPSDNLPECVQTETGMFTPSDAHRLLADSGNEFLARSSSPNVSRIENLTGTDQTLVPEPFDDDKTEVNISEVDSKEESTITDEHDLSVNVKHLFRQESRSQSMSEEFDIPYHELGFGEIIGHGRVGTVHKGYWHGDVAIRVININHDDENKLRAFKQEVMIYKKTRHENLELFMGSCINPPHLAIVTGFCRGLSLYNWIRGNKISTINVNQSKIKIIAQHIVQGMGYLHSKGIIHKDLKSKNIFVEGKRVVITDFGLADLHAVSSSSKRASQGMLHIPDGWLCYLAPEVIRTIRLKEDDQDEDIISSLPYTMQSDVYAFGTVWYELLCGMWPFEDFPAESIIWQVGSGKKENFSHLQGGKDMKEILIQSWEFDPSLRPDFSDNGLMGLLKRLQFHIGRSRSSQPKRGGVNRGISHERLFDSSSRDTGEAVFSATIARSLPRPSQRYHPLLSPIANSGTFVFPENFESLKF